MLGFTKCLFVRTLPVVVLTSPTWQLKAHHTSRRQTSSNARKPRFSFLPERCKRKMADFLQIKNLVKRFGATRALNNATFAVERGEVRALLGENGAGKSTCVKILNGLIAPDSGSIVMNGREYAPRTLIEAHKAKVSTAFQELSLIPELSVAVNLAMPNLPKTKFGLVNFRAVTKSANHILGSYHASDIDPSVHANSLSLADKQRIEIIRAFSRNPELLILDEPTAALTDVSWMYDQIRSLTQNGGAVLFITHRLKEVRDLCERATVLRSGQVAGTVELKSTTDGELFRMMIGRSANAVSVGKSALPEFQRGLKSKPALRARKLKSASFGPADVTVEAGEILGVAALEGQGQRTLFNALAGIEPMENKLIEVFGRKVTISSPGSSRKSGIAFVPEERKEEGLFPELETRANVSISNVKGVSHWGLLSKRNEIKTIRGSCEAVDLEERYYDMPIEQLSGGNQQKALIARALFCDAKCLLLFDPTRGVDIGTKESIYELMRAYAGRGKGILFYSTELSELTRLCHRCLVVYGNQIVGQCVGGEVTEERLIKLMHGSEATWKEAG